MEVPEKHELASVINAETVLNAISLAYSTESQKRYVTVSGAVSNALETFRVNLGRSMARVLQNDTNEIRVRVPIRDLTDAEVRQLKQVLSEANWVIAELDRDAFVVIPGKWDPNEQLISKEQLILTGRWCPYCNCATNYSDAGAAGFHMSTGFLYICPSCGAYVGCHPGTSMAKGMVANAKQRHLRRLAHDAVDFLWKDGYLDRQTVYYRLARLLGKPKNKAHIAMLTMAELQQVISYMNQLQDALANRVDVTSLPDTLQYFAAVCRRGKSIVPLDSRGDS